VKRYAYCPVCGAPLDRSRGASAEHGLLTCDACDFNFWQNSKPAVAAVVIRAMGGEPHVLLTRRGIEPHKGMWDMPGGYLDNGEHPEHGLQRELAEELGTTALNPRFYAVDIDEYPRDDVAEEARFVLSLYYRCDIPPDAVLAPADDVAEAAWFAFSALPVAIAFPSNRRLLAALQESARQIDGDASASG
jgi:NAD+ diphosphatase